MFSSRVFLWVFSEVFIKKKSFFSVVRNQMNILGVYEFFNNLPKMLMETEILVLSNTHLMAKNVKLKNVQVVETTSPGAFPGSAGDPLSQRKPQDS